MKRFIPMTLAATVLVTGGALTATAMTGDHSSSNMHSSSHMGKKHSDQVLCGELVAMDREYVGSMLYYVKGHYDSERNVWTDYGPQSDEGTLMVDNMYLNVPEIVTYCAEYPENTVVQALEESSKKSGGMKDKRSHDNMNHSDGSRPGSY